MRFYRSLSILVFALAGSGCFSIPEAVHVGTLKGKDSAVFLCQPVTLTKGSGVWTRKLELPAGRYLTFSAGPDSIRYVSETGVIQDGHRERGGNTLTLGAHPRATTAWVWQEMGLNEYPLPEKTAFKLVPLPAGERAHIR